MSSHSRSRVAPLIPHSQHRNGKKVENKPASDKTKLVWSETMGPLTAAANALNAVIAQHRDRVVLEAAKRDNVDLKEYVLNVDTMEWQPRPELGRDVTLAHPGT